MELPRKRPRLGDLPSPTEWPLVHAPGGDGATGGWRYPANTSRRSRSAERGRLLRRYSDERTQFDFSNFADLVEVLVQRPGEVLATARASRCRPPANAFRGRS